jgi:histidinol-phosphate aminotransferase
MAHEYDKQADPGEGLRLHLNENTAGCSPRVLEALRRLTTHDLAFYPDYTAVNRDCARFLGVSEDRLLLANGLDEGLLAAAIAYLQREPERERGRDWERERQRERGREHERGPDRGPERETTPGGGAPEAIIVEPAFGMYADCTEATGGRVVSVAPLPDFEFPRDATLAAITPNTRLVFLTSPGNPTGLLVPREALRAIATRLPPGALVVLDEAYADFTEEHFLDELPRWPNVVIGRTFAKSYGLAAVRIGAMIGAPDVIARLRRSLPPYSINVVAATVLAAALEDKAHVAWYREQVARSRELLYAACDRLGLRYWRSEANFVLVRVGSHPGSHAGGEDLDGDSASAAASTAKAVAKAKAVGDRLAAKKIFVRDRSNQPGCAGCVRITTGVVEHTQACIAALEEVLCVEA